MGVPRPQCTADQLPFMSSPGTRLELVRGELIEMAPAGFRHGEVASRIDSMIGDHVRRENLGKVVAAETGFLLERRPDTVLAPDVAFVSHERLGPGESPAGYLAAAPDLVVEVISPTDSLRDVEAKAETWLRFGVKAVWVVDPAERTISVHTPGGPVVSLTTRDRLDGAPALPAFSCPVQALFDD
jgi:Uma2 family endonuclease